MDELESLIAERDAIAKQLKDANQKIADEFNRLYPKGTRLRYTGPCDKCDVIVSSSHVHHADGAIVWVTKQNQRGDYVGVSIDRLSLITRKRRTRTKVKETS